MNCKIGELRNKQVVCVKSGKVLGLISDVEIDTESGSLISLIIYGKPRLLGFFGKNEDIVIPWCDIEVIGPETVLVKSESPYCNLK